jgi:hypothetical protein
MTSITRDELPSELLDHYTRAAINIAPVVRDRLPNHGSLLYNTVAIPINLAILDNFKNGLLINK